MKCWGLVYGVQVNMERSPHGLRKVSSNMERFCVGFSQNVRPAFHIRVVLINCINILKIILVSEQESALSLLNVFGWMCVKLYQYYVS